MTCRIEQLVVEEDLVMLSITGQLTGQDVELLEGLLEQQTKAPILDLSELRLVDREAVKLLALHELHGAELRNCPAYVREWVTKERLARARRGHNVEEKEDVEDASCD